MQWQCTICAYVHDGDEPPEICPVCGAPTDKFVEYKESSWIDDGSL
jgi:rubrerythrin